MALVWLAVAIFAADVVHQLRRLARPRGTGG